MQTDKIVRFNAIILAVTAAGLVFNLRTFAGESTSQQTKDNQSQSTRGAKENTADSLANLGSDRYASGILPLGDERYVTDAPKKGYIYLCPQGARMMGGGAQRNGPWIGSNTWNLRQKISVAGSAMWPNAAVSIVSQGTTRMAT